MRATLFFFALASAASAQDPSFETASIKPVAANAACANGSMIGPMPGGALRVECLPLKAIVAWAFQAQNYQISGLPAWTETERFDIAAKPPEEERAKEPGPARYQDMTDEQRARFMDLSRRRLQALLADRFHLVVRHEAREQTAYVLTVAKGGPKMKESADQSAAGGISRGPGRIKGEGQRMEAFVTFLAVSVQRPVIDQTGLKAHYDFNLTWTPERPASAGAAPEVSEPSGPSIFTAIEEQLGLRLESRKVPVDTLVIDRIERPSEN
jgi:uncharacterized protein (TIGR03435 family)